jgi:hypothetical protein
MPTLQTVAQELAQKIAGDKLQVEPQEETEKNQVDNLSPSSQEKELESETAITQSKTTDIQAASEQNDEPSTEENENKEEKQGEVKEKEKKQADDKSKDDPDDDEAMEKLASRRLQERFRKITAEKKSVEADKARLEKELEELRAQKQKGQAPEESDDVALGDEVTENKKIEERLAKLGFMKKSDWEKERENEKLREVEIEEIEKELKQLADEFPDIYDRKTVVSYMKEKGVTDPRAAFFATSYQKIAPKEKDGRNVGYQGQAGKASGNVVSTGDSIQVGQKPEKTLKSEAERIATTILKK